MRRALAAALAGALATGCGAPLVSLAEGPREYVATDYESVLERWTRSGTLFSLSELENYLTATATYESWDFRWAYVVRYVHDYRLTVDQRKALLAKTLDETRDRHEFFVALWGGSRRESDLTKPDGAWTIRLIDDRGNETAPEDVASIKRPTALERTYFPYNTVFRQSYRIRFPRATGDGRPTIAPDATWFGLRFAGPRGSSQLVWGLAPSERKAPGPSTPKADAPKAAWVTAPSSAPPSPRSTH